MGSGARRFWGVVVSMFMSVFQCEPRVLVYIHPYFGQNTNHSAVVLIVTTITAYRKGRATVPGLLAHVKYNMKTDSKTTELQYP